MRIATKLNILVLAVFAISAAANYAVLQQTIKPKFDDIELAGAKMDHERVRDAIATLAKSLRASAQDYAFWDSCYKFAQGIEVEDFVKNTLSPPDKMLENVSVDAAVFVTPDGQLLWSAAVDKSESNSPSGLVPDILRLDYRHPYLSNSGPLDVASGLIETSQGIALLAVAPIVNSDHSGTPMGTIYFAKKLDVANLAQVTGVPFELKLIPDKTKAAADGMRTFWDEEFVSTQSVLPNIKKEPLVTLTAKSRREVSRLGAAAITAAMGLMMIAAATVMLALWLFVKKLIVARLDGLKRHFARAVNSGRLIETKHEENRDEIGDLGRTFNDMAKQVNDLRDVFADSAYLSGLSEWATGTLHNVSNAITPVNMYALRIQDLFEERWRNNLKVAVAELESADTPPERREKLQAYVKASVHRMLDCADQAQNLSTGIIATNRSIEEIISSYQRFGKKDLGVETVEIRTLISSLSRSMIDTHGAPVELVLPAGTAFVTANRTILRQIISNLIVNALEAMQSMMSSKRIAIALEVDGDSLLHIRVTDSGDGIPPQNIKAIFERGFSTRNHKKGGLGLHWCANAARAMGGALHAESDGAGKGATFVLTLPLSNTALVEAA